MNLRKKGIVEEYRKQRDVFISLENEVSAILSGIIKNLGIETMAIEHRVKTEESLAGKLERKGDSYLSLDDLTDILGARIICFFNDDVDRIGKEIENFFVIDGENSSDKRALVNVDSFGYMSLHYICSLPSGSKWAEELCNKRFEIQIRTALQHAWSVVNHDIGYKNAFGVPREIVRQFARLSGLLELADEEFVRARENMNSYTDGIRQKIIRGEADEIVINSISLNEYVLHNKDMMEITKKIAGIAGAEISEINPEGYIPQLNFLGIKTLGDIKKMISVNTELALELAEQVLSASELDIVSSSVALRFLCRAEILNKNYDFEKTTEFLMLSLGTREKAERQAKYLLGRINK